MICCAPGGALHALAVKKGHINLITSERCVSCDGCGFECSGTDEPICPHCGASQEDWLEWIHGEDTVEHDCDACGEAFTVEPMVSWSFSTSKEVEP